MNLILCIAHNLLRPEKSMSEENTSGTPRPTFVRRFVGSSSVILGITGLGKIWSGLGNSKFLAVIDPILGIKFGHLMLAVGLAEIAVAAVCFFSKRQTSALGLVARISTNFLVYRLGLWVMNWKRPCGCLGNLTDALHISPQTADNIMKLVLAYLLIGSYGLLLWQWRKRALTPAQLIPT